MFRMVPRFATAKRDKEEEKGIGSYFTLEIRPSMPE